MHDVAYSFKVNDPKEVWKDLAKRLRELTLETAKACLAQVGRGQLVLRLAWQLA